MSENDHSWDEDKVMRIRMRHRTALRAGLSSTDATAYANDPNSLLVCAQSDLTARRSTVDGHGTVQWSPGCGHETLAAPALLSPTFSTSPDHRGHQTLIHYPDCEAFQALLAQNFNSFCEFAFGVVRPAVPYKPNWHLEAMAEKLAQVASGKIRRLIITVPPRNLKSLYTSVALPAWFLGHHPYERILVISYSEFLARQHANDFRLLVRDPIYQAAFPAMRLDRDTDREIKTTRRGKRIATSIEGTLTGVGGNLIIIDDPIKPSNVGIGEGSGERVVPLDPAFARRRQDSDADRCGHAAGARE
jgi:hypothetical protein